MQYSSSPAEELVNGWDNSRLNRALRLDARLDSPRSREMLFYALCETQLLVLTAAPAQCDVSPRPVDSRGRNCYHPGTMIPVAMLTAEDGTKVLPAFSDATAVRALQMQIPHCMLLDGPRVMEMLLATDAQYLALNPRSPEACELPRTTVQTLVSILKTGGALPEDPAVEYASEGNPHSFT